MRKGSSLKCLHSLKFVIAAFSVLAILACGNVALAGSKALRVSGTADFIGLDDPLCEGGAGAGSVGSGRHAGRNTPSTAAPYPFKSSTICRAAFRPGRPVTPPPGCVPDPQPPGPAESCRCPPRPRRSRAGQRHRPPRRGPPRPPRVPDPAVRQGSVCRSGLLGQAPLFTFLMFVVIIMPTERKCS